MSYEEALEHAQMVAEITSVIAKAIYKLGTPMHRVTACMVAAQVFASRAKLDARDTELCAGAAAAILDNGHVVELS